MKELQRNAISFSAARLAPAGDGAGAGTGGTEPVIKLSGSFKPAGAGAGAPKDDRFSLPGSSNALVRPGQEGGPETAGRGVEGGREDGGTVIHPPGQRFACPPTPHTQVRPQEPDMPLPPPPRPGGGGAAGAAAAAGGSGGGAGASGAGGEAGGKSAADREGEAMQEEDDDDLGIPDEQTIL